MKTLRIPASSLAPAAKVELADSGEVFLDGTLLGVVWQGEASYSAPAAGHSGRVARYHTTLVDWRAIDQTSRESVPSHEQRSRTYSGDSFPNRRKNTRRAAIAYLLAIANGASRSDARYFTWSPA